MKRLEEIATSVLVACAVIIAGSAVYRTIAPASRSPIRIAAEPPKLVENWEGIVSDGIPLFDSPANPRSDVTIAVFSDLECPFCRRFHKEITELHAEKGIRVLFLHYPLRIHRNARAAAIAAECAIDQGRFLGFLDAVFAQQDSLGLRSWSQFGVDAGVPDTARFDACVRDKGEVPRLQRHITLARSLGVHGTPTVIVNGWLFSRSPTHLELRAAIDSILKGKKPVQVVAR
jgi:protein-disulfide isomerase